MRVLVDGGNSGSGGYLRYLSGIFGSGALDDIEVLLVCSPGVASTLGPLDPQVTLLVEDQLDAPRRWDRLAWWRKRWPQLVAEFEPHVVLHPNGLLRGKSTGVPRVAVHHIMAPFMRASYRLYGMSRMSARLALVRTRLLRSFRRADGVIFLADYTQRHLIGLVPSISQSTVVPNAVTSAFGPLSARHWRDLPSPVKLLCVSTLFLFKYQWNVVAAVAELRRETGLDIQLDFVGGGEPRALAKLMHSITTHQAAGWSTVREVSAAAMPDVYRAADLFVFPSADEAWPITLGEAMASGLPIACSDRMAMPGILRDAGVYFDPEEPAEIAAALRVLLTDADKRQQCSELARSYACEYTWDRSSASVVKFLRDVSSRKS